MPVVNSPVRLPFHLLDSDGDPIVDVTASNYTLRAAIGSTELTLSAPDIIIEQRAVGSVDLVLVYTPMVVDILAIWGLDHATEATNLGVSYIEITQYSTDEAIGRLALKAPLIGQDGTSGASIDVHPDTDLAFSLNILDDNGDIIDITGKIYNFRVGVLTANGSYNTIYQDVGISSSQYSIDILVDRSETKKWESSKTLKYFVEESDGLDRWPRALGNLNIIRIPRE